MTGLGASMVLVGMVLALGTMASQKNLYRDTMVGNYGVAATLVVLGAVLIGAVQG